MIDLNKLDTRKITAEKVRSDYLLFESSSSEYRFQMAEDHEFYLGSQLTKTQFGMSLMQMSIFDKHVKTLL